MSAEEVYPARDSLQEWVFEQVDNLEKSLTDNKIENSKQMAETQTSIQNHVTKTWWELADTLIVRYNDGFFNFGKYFPDRAIPMTVPREWLNMVGYKNDFYRPGEHWIKPAGVEAYTEAENGVLARDDAEGGKSSSWWSVLIGAIVAFFGGIFFERKRHTPESHAGYYQKL